MSSTPEPLPLGPVEGPAYDILDPRFSACIAEDAVVERIWTGSRWTEGPAWLASRGLLIWSDIPGNRMMSWDPATRRTVTFREPANSPNGNTIDRQGRLITCEQIPQAISRTEPDGTITRLVDQIDYKRFNSPNDAIVKSDGSIWFSDPSYGRAKDRPADRDVEGCHVYRFDPASGSVRQMTTDFIMPNGLAFSPDESLLYIIDTGSTEGAAYPNHVRRFRVEADQTLSGGEVLADAHGHFDGLRVDTEGRLWMAADEGVRCYLPNGTLIGRVRLPERAANLTFGGPDRRMLMITATRSVYTCPVNATPAAP